MCPSRNPRFASSMSEPRGGGRILQRCLDNHESVSSECAAAGDLNVATMFGSAPSVIRILNAATFSNFPAVTGGRGTLRYAVVQPHAFCRRAGSTAVL